MLVDEPTIGNSENCVLPCGNRIIGGRLHRHHSSMSAKPQDPAGERFLSAVRATQVKKAALAKRSGINLDRINRIMAEETPARLQMTEVVNLYDAAEINSGEMLRLLWPDRVIDDPQAEIDSLRAENQTLRSELQRIGAQLPTPTRSLLQLLAVSATGRTRHGDRCDLLWPIDHPPVEGRRCSYDGAARQATRGRHFTHTHWSQQHAQSEQRLVSGSLRGAPA